MYRAYFLICPLRKCVRYVGITTKSLNSRLRKHLSDGEKRNQYKYNWIQKLGRNNLIPEIRLVCDHLSKKAACQIEIQLISIMRSIVGQKLTNHHEGGTVPPSWTGKTHTIETKKKFAKPVYQLEKNGRVAKRYYSISEASRITSIDRKSISECCRKIRKTAGTYKWRYA